MPLVFKTPKNGPPVELPGLGVADSDGRGGVPVSDAAEVLHELQDKNGNPKSGAALKKAAEDFAAERDLVVVSLSDSEVEKLPEERGARGVERPPAAQVAEEAAKALRPDPAMLAILEASRRSEDSTVTAADVARVAAELGEEADEHDVNVLEEEPTDETSSPPQTVAPNESA